MDKNLMALIVGISSLVIFAFFNFLFLLTQTSFLRQLIFTD